MLRYQGQLVNELETEGRWNAWRRWSLVGFAGVGYHTDNYKEIDLKLGKFAGGGLRYFLARDFKMHVGIDVAKGPEQCAWYLIFGSYWFR